ncbi:MAG: SMC-Scp complex subunit ScpB [Sandaracinaceae bacterium]|nr:SMC-Scp complex subunit ScpB [Sandaracinaceae bacterium]
MISEVDTEEEPQGGSQEDPSEDVSAEPREDAAPADAAPADAAPADAAPADAAPADAAPEDAAPEDASPHDDDLGAPAERPGPAKVQPASVSAEHLESVVESLIFVSDKPVTARRLAGIAKASTAEVRDAVARLMEHYAPRGIELVELSDGYQFRSAAKNAPFVRDIVAKKPVRLSRAQLETLAIAAYRQPLTKPELEEIRGVDCSSALKVLLERGLLKILGRKEEAGRPLLYGTSQAFLELFGLKSLEELPTLREFSELTDESKALFARRTGEDIESIGDIALPEGASGAEEDGGDEGALDGDAGLGGSFRDAVDDADEDDADEDDADEDDADEDDADEDDADEDDADEDDADEDDADEDDADEDDADEDDADEDDADEDDADEDDADEDDADEDDADEDDADEDDADEDDADEDDADEDDADEDDADEDDADEE